METLVGIGLSNAAVAAGLALVAGAAGRVCRRRPALVHGLWLLVLLKLVTPPLVDVPMPWPAVASEASPAVSWEQAAPGPAVAPAAGERVMDLPAEGPDVVGEVAAEAPADGVPEETPPWPWDRVLCGLWLVGSLGWFLLAGVRVNRFRRLLRHGTAAPEALRARVATLARRLGLRRGPDVLLLPGRLAPLVWAGGRPRLCLPAGLLGAVDGAALDTLLVHELAHLRRRDHWVRRLEFAVLGLYWWNPVAWYARRELREAEEQCCDAWVVAALPGSGRTYATALVDTLDFLSADADAVPLLASGIGRIADLKRRLTMIVRGTTPRGLGRGGVLAVLGLGLLLPLWPHWAQADPPLVAPEAVRAEAADADKQRADLERLEAELRKKLEEVHAQQAKLKAQAADQARVHLRFLADKLVEGKAQAEAAARWERAAADVVRARVGEGKGVRIYVEVSGTEKYDEVMDILKKLEKELGGKARILIAVQRRDGADANALEGKRVVVPPMPPGDGKAGWKVVPTPPAPAAHDKLERRLEDLQRELEALRREIRGSRPGSFPPAKPPTPPPQGPAPEAPGAP